MSKRGGQCSEFGQWAPLTPTAARNNDWGASGRSQRWLEILDIGWVRMGALPRSEGKSERPSLLRPLSRDPPIDLR